ncbi:hypothetical protein V8C34DRAFT_286286 [Trichoderma compactum]
MSTKHSVYTQALRACALALEMYGRLPDATVDPTIVSNISLVHPGYFQAESRLHLP